MPNPRHRVTGPTFTVAPYGLVSVSTVVDDPDPHWRNGIEWETMCAARARATLAPCYQVLDPGPGSGLVDAVIPPKSGAVGAPWAEGDAVTLYAAAECSAVGRTAEADLARASQLLVAGEARGLERVIQSGVTEAGELPLSLAGQATPTGVTGGSIAQVIASLEDALGRSYGGTGVIHMPRSVALLAAAGGLVFRDGQRLVTGLGTLVAAGTGYVADAPWAADVPVYASGAVQLYRGGIVTIDGIDTDVNTRATIAERTWAWAWDCAVHVATVDVAVLVPS